MHFSPSAFRNPFPDVERRSAISAPPKALAVVLCIRREHLLVSPWQRRQKRRRRRKTAEPRRRAQGVLGEAALTEAEFFAPNILLPNKIPAAAPPPRRRRRSRRSRRRRFREESLVRWGSSRRPLQKRLSTPPPQQARTRAASVAFPQKGVFVFTATRQPPLGVRPTERLAQVSLVKDLILLFQARPLCQVRVSR